MGGGAHLRKRTHPKQGLLRCALRPQHCQMQAGLEGQRRGGGASGRGILDQHQPLRAALQRRSPVGRASQDIQPLVHVQGLAL